MVGFKTIAVEETLDSKSNTSRALVTWFVVEPTYFSFTDKWVFPMEEWAKIPEETCATLVKNNSNRFLACGVQKWYTIEWQVGVIILAMSFLPFLVSTQCINNIS